MVVEVECRTTKRHKRDGNGCARRKNNAVVLVMLLELSGGSKATEQKCEEDTVKLYRNAS